VLADSRVLTLLPSQSRPRYLVGHDPRALTAHEEVRVLSKVNCYCVRETDNSASHPCRETGDARWNGSMLPTGHGSIACPRASKPVVKSTRGRFLRPSLHARTTQALCMYVRRTEDESCGMNMIFRSSRKMKMNPLAGLIATLADCPCTMTSCARSKRPCACGPDLSTCHRFKQKA